jgi:hypothetical protein
MFLARKEFGRKHIRFTQYMLVVEAETLCSDTALRPAQVKTSFQVIDVENDFILSDRGRLQIIEVGK